MLQRKLTTSPADKPDKDLSFSKIRPLTNINGDFD